MMQVMEATNSPAEANTARWATELDAFTHSISHDLRAPLRAIDGFSRIVMEDYSASLPAEGKRYLSLVLANAERMNHLLEGLMAFAALGRQSIAKQSVHPSPIAREAWDDLTRTLEGSVPEISLDGLAPCEADRALLKLVFTNLISNAVKFTRRRENARIEISSDKNEAGETIYCVRDNGIGFDMRYAHKLFALFQRLHRAEDYEGAGVGLAIVQRIVNCHGGRAWIESRPDEGTSVFFTLETDPTALAA